MSAYKSRTTGEAGWLKQDGAEDYKHAAEMHGDFVHTVVGELEDGDVLDVEVSGPFGVRAFRVRANITASFYVEGE